MPSWTTAAGRPVGKGVGSRGGGDGGREPGLGRSMRGPATITRGPARAKAHTSLVGVCQRTASFVLPSSLAGSRQKTADMGTKFATRKAAATRSKSPARTTRHGLPGRNSWPGWGRSFHLRAPPVAATSGSEKTAGRSRLTSNRRFASGRRPGWLRPREVRFSNTSANHSSRLASLPLVARPRTGASLSRLMTTAMRFRCRPTSCP